MATTNIRLGSNTLNGVETIKLTDASDTTSKIDFTYGATPSGSVSVKLGENTLTGVNEISVMGTDNVAKSFGYAPSGINFTINYQGSTLACQADTGMTWGDWVSSAYNTGGWIVGDSAPYLNMIITSSRNGYIIYDVYGSIVYSYNTIEAGHSYIFYSEND